MTEPNLWSIGMTAEHFELTLRALRFYEEKKLITPTKRGVSRFYDEHSRKRIHLIVKATKMGFTLKEIPKIIATGEIVLNAYQIEQKKDQHAEAMTSAQIAIAMLNKVRPKAVR